MNGAHTINKTFLCITYFLCLHYSIYCQQPSTNYTLVAPADLYKKGSFIVEKGGLQGINTKKNKQLIPAIYKKVIPVHKELALIIDTNGYYGCYHLKESIPCKYDSMIFCNDSLVVVKSNSKYGLLSINNHELLSTKYKSICINAYGNTLVETFNHYIIVGERLDTIKIDADELNFVDSLYHYSYNNVHVLLNHEGMTIGQGDYNWLFDYKCKLNPNRDTITNLTTIVTSDSLLSFKQNDYWGVVNVFGDTILPAIFDQIFPIKDSLLVFKTGKKYGFANKYGKISLMPFADSLRILNEKSVLFKNNHYWGILDHNGFIKSDTLYECIEEIFTNKCFYTKNKTKNGIIGYDGNLILSCDYPYLLSQTSEGLITVKNESQYLAIVGTEGRQLLDTTYQYQEILDFKRGYARVKKFDKYGFINSEGGLTIATQYPKVGEIVNNRVAVMIKNKWAVVDGWEKMICQPYYSYCSTFVDSVAIASRDNKFLMLGFHGKELFEPKYESISKLYDNRYLVFKGKKAGLINKEGHEIIFTKYDSIVSANDRLLIYKDFGKYGILTLDDVKLCNPSFEKLLLHPTKKEYIILVRGKWNVFQF